MSAIGTASRRDDVTTMGVIGLVHGSSHFFQLVLPPLFLQIKAEFAVGFTELGAMMTGFYLVSGTMQPVAGFLVDRYGARRILLLGLSCCILGVLGCAFAPNLWAMTAAAALIGLGNCVFHPSDFTILNASIDPGRLGRAFGLHVFGGNIGWAAAPATMLGLSGLVGWRGALVGAAVIGLAILAVAWWWRDHLRDTQGATEQLDSPLAALISRPVVLCFLYFLLLALALIAVQNFLPVTLDALHQTPLALAATALTGFLIGAALGVLVGGVLADRSSRHALVVAVGLGLSALAFVWIGLADLPAAVLVAVVSLAGFMSGVTTPSRDMLVRGATPKGATGRVFGFVYSGLDAGSALAPTTIGLLLDGGRPEWVMWLIAVTLAAAILTAVGVGRPARA